MKIRGRLLTERCPLPGESQASGRSVRRTRTQKAAFSAKERLQTGRWTAGGGLDERGERGVRFELILTGRKGGRWEKSVSLLFSFLLGRNHSVTLRLACSPLKKNAHGAHVDKLLLQVSLFCCVSFCLGQQMWMLQCLGAKQKMSHICGTSK